MKEKKYPKFIVGSFIINSDGKLFLRATPSQENKYTCINAKVEWGKTIEETLLNSVLIAQSEKSEVKVASNDSFVVNTRKGSAEVNLQRGTSTSKKFIEGNYVYHFDALNTNTVFANSRM